MKPTFHAAPASVEVHSRGADLLRQPMLNKGTAFTAAQREQFGLIGLLPHAVSTFADPGIISFAGGLPAPEVFPVAEIAAAAQRVLETHGATALQYSTTEGHLPLREMLVRHMGRYGIEVGPDNVLITSFV